MTDDLPWLIGCEESGAVRDAMLCRGIPAVSCDLLPSRSDFGPHLQCDIFEALALRPWRGLIAFPDCTYLTCSAEWAYSEPDYDRYPGIGYHQRVKPGTLVGAIRRRARLEAAEFFTRLWNCGLPFVALENPVGKIPSLTGIRSAQSIQPYQFGDDASKRTCLWLRGLPKLRPTNHVAPRMVNGNPRWGNQTDSGQNKLSPGAGRAKERSATYKGIADAMAKQWGDFTMENLNDI